MFKLNIFHKAKNVIEQRKYYHGSKTKIQDNYIQPRQQFNHEQNAVVTGAFVTSDKDYAKFFALSSCISRGHTRLDNKKIYFEKISDNIKPEFYVYTVYESPDNPFVHDRGTEYYSPSPIKIAESEKCDTAAEIEKLGYTIYVLDEPLKSKPDKESGNNFAAHKEMDKAIKEQRYHRVDIAKLIEQQSQRKYYHGSGIKITDGVIHSKPAHINNMQTEMTAVFATTDFVHAKTYAMMRLISTPDGWKAPKERDVLYLEKINPNFPKHAYVYELDSEGFKKDVDDSYYCESDKKIVKTHTIDIMQEIISGNIKVYVLKDKNMPHPSSLEDWRKIVQNKDNFELYEPDSKKIELAAMVKSLKNTSQKA